MYVGKMGEVLAARGYDVTFVVKGDRFPAPELAEAYGLDLSRIRFRPAPPDDRTAGSGNERLGHYFAARRGSRDLSEPFDVFIYCTSGEVPPRSYAGRGVLAVCFPCVSYDSYHGYDEDAWRRQPGVVRALRRRYHAWKWHRTFSSYDLVITISDFARQWVRRRWQVDSTVVFPPARVAGAAQIAKRRLIVSLGRFMPDKKHDVLVGAFRRMCDRGVSDWHLALIGGSSRLGEADPYLSALRSSAQGYPIEIHTDLPGQEVNRLIEESSLFWHAKGFGEDAENHPQEFEHFGIATVEAMAAGSVPLVYRGGGQVEIVRHGADGLLWGTADELIAQSEELIRDARRRERLARSARERADHFSGKAFESRFLDAIMPVLGGGPPSRDADAPGLSPGLAALPVGTTTPAATTQP
jgi:glycosyltransferase involved in cell wall biosynthesis